MDLLPWRELEEIAKVYTAGAKKYGTHNWENLPDGYERYKGAMLRHLCEVEKGNAVDDDTGCLHCAQVAWNAIAMLHFKLIEYQKKMTGFKRGARNIKGHRWINYPNTAHQKCTKCGCRMDQVTGNGESRRYYTLNRIRTTECPDCINPAANTPINDKELTEWRKQQE